MLSLLISTFSACNFSQTSRVNKVEPVPIPINKSVDNPKSDVEDSEEGNEIKNCTPKKLYRGDTFEIIFAKKHGGKMLVYREPRENFYFLDTLSPDEEGGFPKLTEAEIEKSLSLQLNTETTRKTNFRKTDSSDNYVVDRVFNKTGWYRVVIGHQSLDVNFIDMPVTGSCRVYYINKKRPHGK